jgi:hypothetical protein
MIKSGAYLADNLLDPTTATSQELLDCPFSRVFGRTSVFEFFEKPENEYRLRRFSAAMVGTSTANRSGALLTGTPVSPLTPWASSADHFQGFNWKSLKQDALVVDVGGGVGSSTLQLFNAHPHLRYVVQDRPKVIPDAVKVCLYMATVYNHHLTK